MNRALRTLQRARARGLRRLAAATTQKQQRAAATDIAGAYTTTLRRLRAAAPTAYVSPAHAKIVSAARRARNAYAALALAARAGNRAGYHTARRSIRVREAKLRAAVARLGALGFRF